MQPAPEVAQLPAVRVRQVARVAACAAHQLGGAGTVARVQAVPVVAAGAEDLEDDEPGNEASEHARALPGECRATRAVVGRGNFPGTGAFLGA
jgi:hypothetical protein